MGQFMLQSLANITASRKARGTSGELCSGHVLIPAQLAGSNLHCGGWQSSPAARRFRETLFKTALILRGLDGLWMAKEAFGAIWPDEGQPGKSVEAKIGSRIWIHMLALNYWEFGGYFVDGSLSSSYLLQSFWQALGAAGSGCCQRT